MADIVNEVCCNFPLELIAVDYSQEPTFRTWD